MMKVIADVSIVPIGVGVSVSGYVRIAHKKLAAANLNAKLCPYGTVVEGDYEAVVTAIREAMEAVHEAGAPRITMTIKMGSRTDKEQTAQDKLDAVLGR